MTLVRRAYARSAPAARERRATEQPGPGPRDPPARAPLPPGDRVVAPGTRPVAISARNAPPLARRAR
ncbi:ABC transporter substrate-binding protein, partial [Klebsiella pneumoniae]|nr:ABC transporter substrate-binding protein [Klebsiella pneumoniae]